MSRNGKLLGKISLQVFDTPDGNHGAIWKNRIFPFGISSSEIDISTDQYFKPEECEECLHVESDSGVSEFEPHTEDQRTDELTPLASRGVRLLDQLKLLVLEVMLEEPDCSPDGIGIPTVDLEQKAGLDLRLAYHNSELTWSVLTSLAQDGMAFSVPGTRTAWRLTRSADGTRYEGPHFEVPPGGLAEPLPAEWTDALLRFSEKTKLDDVRPVTDEAGEAEGSYRAVSDAGSQGDSGDHASDQDRSIADSIVQCPRCNGSVMEFDKFCGRCSNPL